MSLFSMKINDNIRSNCRYGSPRSLEIKKGLKVLFAVLVLLAFGVMPGCAGKTGPSSTTTRSAVIVSFEGSVMVQAADQAVALPALENMEVAPGDRIITGNHSGAELLFDDGSMVRIDSNSRISILELHSEGEDGAAVTVIENSKGSTWNKVKELVLRDSRFDVNTPAAIAGVRGTLFVVKVDHNGETLVRVYKGSVAAASPGLEDGFTVDAFQQALFTPGIPSAAAPEPLDLLTVELFEMICLALDDPGLILELLEMAMEEEQYAFLEWVQDLLTLDQFVQALGEKLQEVQELLESLLDKEHVSGPGSGNGPYSEPQPGPDPEPEPAPPETFTITLYVGDGEGVVYLGGTMSKGGVVSASYSSGSLVTIKAKMGDGYEFIGWYEDGKLYDERDRFSFNITRDYVLVAEFQPE